MKGEMSFSFQTVDVAGKTLILDEEEEDENC